MSNEQKIQKVNVIISYYNNLFKLISDFLKDTKATTTDEGNVLQPLDTFIGNFMAYQKSKMEDK